MLNKKAPVVQSVTALVNLLVPSFAFLRIAIAGILVYGILFYTFSFCLRKFFKKSKKTNLQLKILAFAYLLYWWFIDEIYNATISTESVSGRCHKYSN